MAPLPKDFVACEKETLQGDTKMEANGTEQFDFKKRDAAVITRCLLWSAWPLNPTATTEEAFDRIWEFLGTASRYLSVRRGTDDSLWALLFKGDQAEINLDKAPEDIRPVALYEIPKPGKGQAATRAIAQFMRTHWFAGYIAATSNFQLNPEAHIDFASVFHNVKNMGEEELIQLRVQTKLAEKGDRSPGTEGHALLKCGPEIQQLRRLGKKRESQRKLQDGIVFRIDDSNCTKLVYPDDVPKLAGKVGQTYNPLTKENETVTLSEYVDTKLHLEKTLVLWGAGGNQKTPCAEAIAKEFAIRYDTKYIKGNGPEALKKVQEEFERLVPVIFEEFSADDVAQNGKKLSANYFKHLLDVRNGGQVRVRNVMLHFKPLQPRIICINDTPKEWLQAIEGVKDTDKLPLEKRVLFVHVDELVISPKAVAAYEADLDEIVNAGKRRRLEHYSTASSEISSTATNETNDDKKIVDDPEKPSAKRAKTSSDPVKDDLKLVEDTAPVASAPSKAEDETSEYSYYSDSDEDDTDEKKL